MRAVSAIIKHRNFDGNTYNHDIALLKLRKPVTFTKNIMPVCLPADESDPSGKTGIAVGWGRTSEGGALPGEYYCQFRRCILANVQRIISDWH